MRIHENICVFSQGVTIHECQTEKRMIYNPQKTKGVPYSRTHIASNVGNLNHAPSQSSRDFVGTISRNEGDRYPTTIMRHSIHNVGNEHPTAKPLDLMETLVKTYSNEGDTILDFTFGSCTTGLACLKTGRKFIGIERDETYFNVGRNRLEKYLEGLSGNLFAEQAHFSCDKIGSSKPSFQLDLPLLPSQTPEKE